MKRNPIITFLAVAATAIAVVALTGCRPSRGERVAGADAPAQTGDVSLDTRFKALASGYGEWSDVTVPVSVSLSKPKRLNVSGRVRMARGRSLDISLRVLGIEMARLYVTADSAYALYRPDRVYMAESLEDFTARFPLNVGNLQDVLTGRAFVAGKATVAPASRKVFDLTEGETPGAWSITPRQQPEVASYGFMADMNNVVTAFGATDPDRRYVLTVSYPSVCDDTPAGPVAASDAITVVAPKFAAELRIDWRWGSAKWNTGAPAAWETPRGYRRIPAATLFKSLSL